MKTTICLLLNVCMTFFLVACSGSPTPGTEQSQEAATPPEPVTGRAAFQQMYVTARGWAPDVQLLRLESIPLREVPPQPGKAGAWEATFTSQSRSLSRTYTFSVVASEGDLYEGVFAKPEQRYTASRGRSNPFAAGALRTDSDEAHKIAFKRAGQYAKRNPDVNILYLLESTPEFDSPAWRVVWGASVATSDYSVFVDATTGEFLKTVR